MNHLSLFNLLNDTRFCRFIHARVKFQIGPLATGHGMPFGTPNHMLECLHKLTQHSSQNKDIYLFFPLFGSSSHLFVWWSVFHSHRLRQKLIPNWQTASPCQLFNKNLHDNRAVKKHQSTPRQLQYPWVSQPSYKMSIEGSWHVPNSKNYASLTQSCLGADASISVKKNGVKANMFPEC